MATGTLTTSATKEMTSIPRPRKFKGSPGDNDDVFEAQCNRILTAHNLTGDVARDWVFNQLGGEAYDRVLDIYNDQLTVAGIFRELQILFGKSEAGGRLHDKFWALKQKAGESVPRICEEAGERSREGERDSTESKRVSEGDPGLRGEGEVR